MRHRLSVCTLGEYAELRFMVDLTGAAVEAGWEALFVWDHPGLAWGVPSGDPWVTLAAVAQATTRLRIGTGITRWPVAARRCSPTPWPASTNSAAAGRFKVPVSVWFGAFGEPDNPRLRAERLDEALELVAALLSDARVARVPIWTGLDHDRTALRLPSAAFRLAVITS